MLQSSATIYAISTKFTSRLLWRLNVPLSTNAPAVIDKSVNNNKKVEELKQTSSNIKNNKEFVALEELKTNLCNDININSSIITQIQNAQNLYELLKVMQTPSFSSKDVSNVLQSISLWLQKNESKSSTIDDTNSVQDKNTNMTQTKILNDNEDILKYQNLSTSQMIMELNKMAESGNRNIQVMNYFFQSIIDYNEMLSVKECSRLISNMSSLCYSDERLLEKICKDIRHKYKVSNKISTVTIISIIKAMSMVRYKNVAFLNDTCDQIISKYEYKCYQVVNLLMSFAILGYYSPFVDNLIKRYKTQLETNLTRKIALLNYVWSLTIFNVATASDIGSVLNEQFISQLMYSDAKKQMSIKLKLLNINGFAKNALSNYSGPFLHNETESYIVSKRTKQKELYIDALETTLKNMLPSSSYFKMNVNSEMGFLIDAELCVDSNLKFVNIQNVDCNNSIKVAIMVNDYYDICLGSNDQLGLCKLYNHLLTCKKYKVLNVSYQNFGLNDKNERRISYLREHLITQINTSFK